MTYEATLTPIMAKKKAAPQSSTSILDYCSTLSLYERESLAAEAKLAAEREIRKRPKPLAIKTK
jgi:hypothetical protein